MVARHELRTFMRLLLLPLVAGVFALMLGGCVIRTPDTADSGTGFEAEARWPWDCRPDDCDKQEPDDE